MGLVITVTLMTIFRPQPQQPPDPSATILSISFWGSYEEWLMWREIADGFERQNPDIWLDLNYIPGNYDDKIQLLLAADNAPDIMLIQDEPLPSYAEYGKFADLTEWAYGPDAPVDWDTAFWPAAAKGFIHEGRVMGAPIWGGNVLVYYNRRMFREMGVEPPRDDWTFDDFVAKGKELTRDTNGDGRMDTFGLALPGWLYFLPFTRGFGARYLNEERTDWVFTGPEAVAATRFYQGLRFRHHIAPSAQEVPQRQEGAMFMTERLGMFVGGPWTSPGLLTAGIDFDVAHIPTGPTGNKHTRISWDGLCVFSKSKHKEEALRFLAYAIGDEAQSIVGRYTRSIPALIAAKDSFLQPDNGWNEEKFVEALAYSRYQPISTRWHQMVQVMNPVYDKVLLNKISPEDAVAEMARGMREQHVFPIEEDE